MRFGTWNVRSLCRLGSPTAAAAAARELARYKSDLVSVQEVRWDREGVVRAADYNFSMEKETESSVGNRIFFVQHRTVSAVKRVEFLVMGCHI
jgi:exonuclease III